MTEGVNVLGKWLKVVLTALCVLGMAHTVYAAATQDVTVTVTVQVLAVEVADTDDPHDFGAVDIGTQTVSASSVTITNDGNGIEDFELQITGSPANLAIEETAAAPGQDEYKLYALFDNDGQIGGDAVEAADFDENDLILESATRRTDTFFDSGDNDADDVAASATVEMWMMFYAPSNISAFHPQQTITITVTAQAG